MRAVAGLKSGCERARNRKVGCCKFITVMFLSPLEASEARKKKVVPPVLQGPEAPAEKPQMFASQAKFI